MEHTVRTLPLKGTGFYELMWHWFGGFSNICNRKSINVITHGWQRQNEASFEKRCEKLKTTLSKIRYVQTESLDISRIFRTLP